MYKDIKTFVDTAKCTEILKKLIQTNSTHPLGNEMNVVNEILLFFRNVSLNYKILDHGSNRGSLVITVPGKNHDQSLVFLGHIDTVPVEDYDEWEYPPFEGVVDGEYIYGRGSADMKGGVAAMILTALYLLENEITPSKDIYFCFTADEEQNGQGVLAIKNSGILDNAGEIFIAEPSNEELGLAEKGALWLGVVVEGLSAHGSRPDLGVNAVEYLIDYISRFKHEMNNDDSNPLLGKTTIAVNQFQGGVKTNVIPTIAKASLDIRTIPIHEHEHIINMARKIAMDMMEKTNNLTITINIENNRPAVETNENHKFIAKLRNLCESLSHEVNYKGLYFYTDASQIIPDLKVPFVILGPGDDSMAHQRNEKIKLSSVSKIAELYISYILKN